MPALGEADRRAVARYLHALDERDGRLDAGLATELERLSTAQFDVLVAAMVDGERGGGAPLPAPAPASAPAGRRPGRFDRVFGPAAEELRTVFKVGGALLAGAVVATGLALVAVGGLAPMQMTAEPAEPAPTTVGETADHELLDELSDSIWEAGADDWY